MAGHPHGPVHPEDVSFSPDEEIRAYRTMVLIRRFEEKAGQLYALQATVGACPLSIGQEASIAGMMMAARDSDPAISGHRTHGVLLGRGVDPGAIMMELLGHTGGLADGKGGTLKMFAPEHRFYGGHGNAALGVPLGAGLAFASRYRGDDAVTLSFFGEGAAALRHRAVAVAVDEDRNSRPRGHRYMAHSVLSVRAREKC